MIFDLIRDFADMLDAMPQEHPRHRVLKLLDEAIRRDVQFIDRHPTTFFQCMWNTCWWYDCPEKAKHYGDTTTVSGPMKWLSKLLTPPIAVSSSSTRSESQLSSVLHAWRSEKEERQPGSFWVRSLRPPTVPLGTGQTAVLRGHIGYVASLAMSRDERLVVSGGSDKTIQIWDMESGELLKVLKGHNSTVDYVAVMEDGRRIVSSSSYFGDYSIRVWDAWTGRQLEVFRPSDGHVARLAMNYDQTCCATASPDGAICLWCAETGIAVRILRGHHAPIRSLVWTADNRRLVSGSEDKTVRVWNSMDGTVMHVLRGHRDYVTDITISDDGQRIASASLDKTVRVWHAISGECVAILRGHDELVCSVALNADGSIVASSCGNSKSDLRLWDLQNGANFRVLHGHEGAVTCIIMSANGRRVISGSNDQTVRIWDSDSIAGTAQLKGSPEETFHCMAMSADGRRIVTGSHDGIARVWDAETGIEMAVLKGHRNSIYDVGISADGRLVVTCSGDKSVRVWDLARKLKCTILRGHTDIVWRVDVNADGSRIVSVSSDGTTRLWDAVKGLQLAVLNENGKGFIPHVSISPDGRFVITTHQDNSLRVWDSLTISDVKALSGHERFVTNFGWSADSLRFVSESCDGLIREWDVQSWRISQTFQCDGRTDDRDTGLAAAVACSGADVLRAGTKNRETCFQTEDKIDIAWYPTTLSRTMINPNGRMWAGVQDTNLVFLRLEGSGCDHPRIL